MAKDSIRLSQKHGVNPSLMLCFACMEDAGVALLGLLPGDREAPRRILEPGFFCKRCEDLMKGGAVFIIETPDGSHVDGGNNPPRTGRMAAVNGAAFRRMAEGMDERLLARIERHHLCFMERQQFELAVAPAIAEKEGGGDVPQR